MDGMVGKNEESRYFMPFFKNHGLIFSFHCAEISKNFWPSASSASAHFCLIRGFSS